MRTLLELDDLIRVSRLYIKGIMKPDVEVSDPKPEFDQNDDFKGISLDIKPALTPDQAPVE